MINQKLVILGGGCVEEYNPDCFSKSVMEREVSGYLKLSKETACFTQKPTAEEALEVIMKHFSEHDIIVIETIDNSGYRSFFVYKLQKLFMWGSPAVANTNTIFFPCPTKMLYVSNMKRIFAAEETIAT